MRDVLAYIAEIILPYTFLIRRSKMFCGDREASYGEQKLAYRR
jgi:hypothetical protein